MGFNIGGIIAGAAKGATATMRNRMNAHEKTLAEEKRLRTSAEIQTEFEEKSAEKKEKRQAERDAEALRNLGYEPELVAKFLRGGEASITQASQWAVDALKKGVNVNTIYKASSVKGANLSEDTQQINNILNVATENDVSETVSAFDLDTNVLKTIYAPKPTDKSLDALYANAAQRELKALQTGNEKELREAQTEKSAYLLSIKQKHIANSKADKPFEAFSKPSISTTFKLAKEDSLRSLGDVGIIDGVMQLIGGSKGLDGIADLITYQTTRDINRNTKDEIMSDQFEAQREGILFKGRKNLIDYANNVDETSSNLFKQDKVDETGASVSLSTFSYDDALKFAQSGKIKVGQVIKVKDETITKRRMNGEEYTVSGIFNFIYLGAGFKNNNLKETGEQILDNFFTASFIENN